MGGLGNKYASEGPGLMGVRVDGAMRWRGFKSKGTWVKMVGVGMLGVGLWYLDDGVAAGVGVVSLVLEVSWLW
jgi:hypothetical protein